MALCCGRLPNRPSQISSPATQSFGTSGGNPLCLVGRSRSEVVVTRARTRSSNRPLEWARRLGALPPKRMIASWSGPSTGPTEYKGATRSLACQRRAPLGSFRPPNRWGRRKGGDPQPDQALRRARNRQHRFAPPPAVPTAMLTAAPRGSLPGCRPGQRNGSPTKQRNLKRIEDGPDDNQSA